MYLHHVGVGLVTSLCLVVERLEVLSMPRLAAEPIDAARMGERLERLVKPKIETKREERPRPKTTAPKAVDKIAFQLVDGPALMRLKLTYVMKGDRKIPTINAVTRFSALGEAEEFRRRLRLSGINASAVSRGASGFEMTVPKDELEKLTPEEKKAIKQYLEHVTQTGDKEKKKAAEDVMSRFDFGAKAINIGGIRLKLAYDSGKIKAKKIRRPIAYCRDKDDARKQAKRNTGLRI
jgi:hypothetical protein